MAMKKAKTTVPDKKGQPLWPVEVRAGEQYKTLLFDVEDLALLRLGNGSAHVGEYKRTVRALDHDGNRWVLEGSWVYEPGKVICDVARLDSSGV